MSGALISVVIPVYRAEKTINECLDSVLTQGIDNIEIICVDDGSDDRSPYIISEYAKTDPRIKLLTQKNLYAGVARNRGLEEATGEYVAFLDSDDLLLPGSLSMMYKEAKKRKLDVLKAGFIYYNNETKKKYRTLYSINSSIGFFDRMRVLNLEKRPLRLLHVADVPWNGLYRREFLMDGNIRFNSLRCVNDHSFFIHCLLAAKRIGVTKTPVVAYRVMQSDSLVGKKAYYFENQIASYNIVKKLCESTTDRQSKLIMERELYSLFSWYGQLRNEASKDTLDGQMRAFLSEFDERDVRPQFTESFAYNEQYHRLKPGSPPPKKRGKLRKLINCYREHGLGYTVGRLFGTADKQYKA